MMLYSLPATTTSGVVDDERGAVGDEVQGAFGEVEPLVAIAIAADVEFPVADVTFEGFGRGVDGP